MAGSVDPGWVPGRYGGVLGGDDPDVRGVPLGFDRGADRRRKYGECPAELFLQLLAGFGNDGGSAGRYIEQDDPDLRSRYVECAAQVADLFEQYFSPRRA